MSTIIETIIASCPDNVFTCLRVAFRRNIDPAVDNSYLYQVYILSGLLGLSLIIQLLTLALRAYKGTFQLFRIQKYIVPHFTVAWTFFNIFLLASCQGFIWSRINTEKGENVHDLAEWVLLPWLPGILAFYFSAYSLLVSHLIHKSRFQTLTNSIFLRPTFINIAGITMPILFIINIAVMVILANNQYRQGLTDYISIDGTFAIAEQQWNTLPFNPTPLIMSQADLIVNVNDRLQGFLKWFKYTFVCYLVFGILTEIFLLIVGVLHLRTLKRGLETIKNGAALYGDGKLSSEEKRLSRKYTSLVLVTIILAIVTTLFNANFTFVVASAAKVLSKTVYFEVSTLLPLYLFALGGLPLSIYMLYQVIVDRPVPQTIDDSDLTRQGSLASKSLVDHSIPSWTSATAPNSTQNHSTPTYMTPSRSSSYKYNNARDANHHQPTIVELKDLNLDIRHSPNSLSSDGEFGMDHKDEWNDEGLERSRDFGYSHSGGRASQNRDNWI